MLNLLWLELLEKYALRKFFHFRIAPVFVFTGKDEFEKL